MSPFRNVRIILYRKAGGVKPASMYRSLRKLSTYVPFRPSFSTESNTPLACPFLEITTMQVAECSSTHAADALTFPPQLRIRSYWGTVHSPYRLSPLCDRKMTEHARPKRSRGKVSATTLLPFPVAFRSLFGGPMDFRLVSHLPSQASPTLESHFEVLRLDPEMTHERRRSRPPRRNRNGNLREPTLILFAVISGSIVGTSK